jgi:phospholipase D1/2
MNAYKRNIEAMPDFPRTGLPYFNFLNRHDEQEENKDEGEEDQGPERHKDRRERRRLFEGDLRVSRSEFAKKQREELESYLLKLIRTVMFHPTANRLCKFLEISALSIFLAQSGGSQTKAGLLRIEGISPKSGAWGRKGVSWRERKKTRWAAVRESYLVAVEDPSECIIWDCWLIDGDFRIERPKRYYRLIGASGVNFEKGKNSSEKAVLAESSLGSKGHHSANGTLNSGFSGTMHSIKRGAGKLFHLRHFHENNGDDHHHRRVNDHSTETNRVGNDHSSRTHSGSTISSSSSTESGSSRPPTPLLDPSTNVDQLRDPNPGELEKATRDNDTKTSGTKKKKHQDASRHTFYLVNSQSRLRCTASTEATILSYFFLYKR